MATIEECIINKNVTVTMGGQSCSGVIVGRRYNNSIEG